MENNVFCDFAIWYYSKLKELANYKIYHNNYNIYIAMNDAYLEANNRNNHKLFNHISAYFQYKKDEKKLEKRSKKLRLEPALIKDQYKSVEALWNGSTSISEWVDLVKQFSIFLRFAEKCFMYKNESSIDKDKPFIVYSENDNNECLYIRDNRDSVKIKFTFKKTEIADIADNSNSLLEYINSGNTSPKTLEFVNIFISREFGKQVCNEFNFLMSENPEYKSKADEILMDSIRVIVSDATRIIFKDILDRYITHFAGFNLGFEALINEEYWITD